jgi:putative endonuclease
VAMRDYLVYILSSPARTLYIGVTNNPERRVWQQLHDGFIKRYDVTMLVNVETSSDPASAIEREKQLKNWTRAKKIALIESQNPDWLDVSADWYR